MEAGADAVIAMPPFLKKASGPELTHHFQAIADVGLPVIVQNAAWLTGAGTLTAEQLRGAGGDHPPGRAPQGRGAGAAADDK